MSEGSEKQLELLAGILDQLRDLNGVRDEKVSTEELDREPPTEGYLRLTETDIDMQSTIFGKCGKTPVNCLWLLVDAAHDDGCTHTEHLARARLCGLIAAA